MIRSRLYILLIGVFVIGAGTLILPLGGTATAITAEEMLADPLLKLVPVIYPRNCAVLFAKINRSMTVMPTLPKICGARCAHSLSKAKLTRLFYLIYVRNMVTLFFWPRQWQKHHGLVAGPDWFSASWHWYNVGCAAADDCTITLANQPC